MVPDRQNLFCHKINSIRKIIYIMNWYDLPEYYDVSFSHEMQDELRFLKAVFAGPGKEKPVRLLEPACGSGRLIVPLARAGFRCTGFDQNPEALNYLKKNFGAGVSAPESSKRIWRNLPSAPRVLTGLSAR